MTLSKKAVPWNIDTGETILVVKLSDVLEAKQKLKEQSRHATTELIKDLEKTAKVEGTLPLINKKTAVAMLLALNAVNQKLFDSVFGGDKK